MVRAGDDDVSGVGAVRVGRAQNAILAFRTPVAVAALAHGDVVGTGDGDSVSRAVCGDAVLAIRVCWARSATTFGIAVVPRQARALSERRGTVRRTGVGRARVLLLIARTVMVLEATTAGRICLVVSRIANAGCQRAAARRSVRIGGTIGAGLV